MTNTVERPRGSPGRIMFGTYRLPRDAGRLLGVAEERRLARRAARGARSARQKLVEHNLQRFRVLLSQLAFGVMGNKLRRKLWALSLS